MSALDVEDRAPRLLILALSRAAVLLRPRLHCPPYTADGSDRLTAWANLSIVLSEVAAELTWLGLEVCARDLYAAIEARFDEWWVGMQPAPDLAHWLRGDQATWDEPVDLILSTVSALEAQDVTCEAKAPWRVRVSDGPAREAVKLGTVTDVESVEGAA